MEVHPDDRTVVAQQTQRQRSESGREELLVVPTVEDALRSSAQRRELSVERSLRDGDNLVKSIHLRALDGIARRVTAFIGELEGPPTAVGVLMGGRGELGHQFPTCIAGVDNVVSRALENVKILFGEEFDDKPPGFLS